MATPLPYNPSFALGGVTMARVSLRNFLQQGEAVRAPEVPVLRTDATLLLANFEQSKRGWFWATDAAGCLTYISPTIAEMIGKSVTELVHTSFTDIFAPMGHECAARDRLPFVLSRRADIDGLIQQTIGEGGIRWWALSGRVRNTGEGDFAGYVGFSVDVTDQRNSSETASQMALYDALTGLPNRLHMSRRIEESVLGIQHPGRSCAVLLIDLDRFKAVNDSLGHPAGDALLKQVAHRLTKIVGEKEKVFRLGGDEFQVIMPNCDDRADLGQLAHEIIASVSQPYLIDGSRCIIGASVGLAIGPGDGMSGEALIRNADLALYSAKGSGRGCYRFYCEDMLHAAEDRRALEEDLRDALAKNELTLFYQPIVSSRTNAVTGVEALIRWHHPTRGSVSPAVFIPIAEEADLITRLGEWIIRKACDDAAGWPADIRVAVNVSPIQFANENLPQIITSALANSGLTPKRLEVELTEGIFLSESTETDDMFAALKRIGVRLALDDFGTGYSSLGYLKTAPFDKIKIDQSFVRGATLPGSRNGAIIAAIVALAGALEMETTAEGIESFDQLDLIHDLGVSHVQGYVYSQAIPSEELARQLQDGAWTIVPDGPARQRSDRRSMYRKGGAIVGSFYHSVIIRNLSESGALIEGLVDVPLGAQIIVDFGKCQLTVATVRRVQQRGHGVEFGQPLVIDDVGDLGTSHRVAPYLLARCGLSGAGELGGSRRLDGDLMEDGEGIVVISRNLGLKMPPRPTDPLFTNATRTGIGKGDGAGADNGIGAIEGADPLGGFAPTGLRGDNDPVSAPAGDQIHHKVQQLFAASNPLQGMSLSSPGGSAARHLTQGEWDRLKIAVEESQNTQLKYIIALVVVTGCRFQELLAARWNDVDLPLRRWTVVSAETGTPKQIMLVTAALQIMESLPQIGKSGHLIVNPRTKKPFQSVFGSWDAARKKAGLANLSIHDLRNSIQRNWQM